MSKPNTVRSLTVNDRFGEKIDELAIILLVLRAPRQEMMSRAPSSAAQATQYHSIERNPAPAM